MSDNTPAEWADKIQSLIDEIQQQGLDVWWDDDVRELTISHWGGLNRPTVHGVVNL